MTERNQLLLLQIVGTAVAVAIAAGAAYMASKGYVIPAVIVSNAVTGLLAKLFGSPLHAVTLQQVSNMPVEKAAEVATRAIESLPPVYREQISMTGAAVVLKGISSRPPPQVQS